MKTKGQIVVMLALLFVGSRLWAQEEGIYEHFAAHKEWNTAYVKDMVFDTDLVVNGIVVQAYSDEEWDSLLREFKMEKSWACKSDTLRKYVTRWGFQKMDWMGPTMGPDEIQVFITCHNRTVVMFFPRSKEQLLKIGSMFLRKELLTNK